MNITIGKLILISIVPAILWFLFYHLNRKNKEPLKLLIFSFIFGMIGALIIIGIEYYYFEMTGNSILNKFISKGFSHNTISFIFSFIEEIVKDIFIFFIIFFNLEEINTTSDGVEYGITVGLGFAFFENIYYFFSILGLQNMSAFMNVYLFRSLGTMFAHSIFSGLFGYIVGYVLYDSLHEQKIIKKFDGIKNRVKQIIFEILTFHIFLNHLLQDKASKKGHNLVVAIVEGAFLGIVLHFIFNMLLHAKFKGIDLYFLIVPVLVILGLLMLKIVKSSSLYSLE